jgi:hypothetical protein
MWEVEACWCQLAASHRDPETSIARSPAVAPDSSFHEEPATSLRSPRLQNRPQSFLRTTFAVYLLRWMKYGGDFYIVYKRTQARLPGHGGGS